MAGKKKNEKEDKSALNLDKLKRIKQQYSTRELNKQADILHIEAFKKINCLDCAGCCKHLPPLLTGTDCRRIATHLRISERAFQSAYTLLDFDGDRTLNGPPCPFLEATNYCKIYSMRPDSCRQYPHTGDGNFDKQIRLHAENMTYCPAVRHIVKGLDNEIS